MGSSTQLTLRQRELLAQLLRGPSRSSGVPRPADASCWAPLSYWQLHIWRQAQVAQSNSPGVQPFNETVTIHRTGTLDVGALRNALSEIVRRHEAWRTVFPIIDGHPVQKILPASEVSLCVSDLRDLPESMRHQEALQLANQDARQPFDLTSGPLLRARLVQMTEAEHKLFLTIHQIILDGVSVYHVFIAELIAFYNSFSRREPSRQPDLDLQYRDYVHWHRERVQQMAARQIAYWRKQLAGLSALPLPTDRARPRAQTFRGTIEPFAFSSDLSSGVRSLTRRLGGTLFVTLLAAFYALLHRYTGQKDLAVGTIAPTRKQSGTHGLLGYFLNPVVLRADLSADPTFAQLAAQARNIFLDALSNDDVPFDWVADELQRPDASRHPLYQVQISLEPPLGDLQPGWNLTPMDFESGGAKLDLYMVFDDRADGIMGRAQYNPDLFNQYTIRQLIAEFKEVLEVVVTSSATVCVSDLLRLRRNV